MGDSQSTYKDLLDRRCVPSNSTVRIMAIKTSNIIFFFVCVCVYLCVNFDEMRFDNRSLF